MIANTTRNKYETMTRKENDQMMRNIVNCDTKSDDQNLDMFREIYHNHKLQRAKKTKRQLEKEIINRIEIE